MTLDSKLSKAVYQGNGSTTVFPFAFKVWNTSQITVTMTDAAGASTDVTSNCTVTLTSSGGSVTYPKSGSPLPGGAKLAITRNMPFTQGINLTTASRFDPQVLEDGLDQGTAERQQIVEMMERAVILPPTSSESPEDVVLSVYASRDAAAASASAASTQATAAEASAQAASGKADESAASAAASAQSAANAYAASEGMAPRMDAAEAKNTQQDTRLDAAEQGISAISATLIGSVMSVMAADGYVPNGTVPADAAEYTREQFREFYDTYLAGGKLLTCTYAAFTAQVALTGNCAKFALDTAAQKFKVPLLKNGDSITHAASATELGKSVKAGLPNITGTTGGYTSILGAVPEGATGALVRTTAARGVAVGTGGIGCTELQFNAAASNSIYGNSTTVTDEQVRLRHFVVLASAQNSASLFDWSNYMAGLAGKANLDMNNLTATGTAKIAGYGKPSGRSISMTFPAYGNFSAPAPASGFVKAGGSSTAAGQWLRISKMPGYTSDDLRYSSLAGQWLIVTLPVCKGDTVFVDGNIPNSLALTFIYDAGAD
ncbi:hypothetical protein DSECCO2_25680 [anaerobic digester metagenome]